MDFKYTVLYVVKLNIISIKTKCLRFLILFIEKLNKLLKFFEKDSFPKTKGACMEGAVAIALLVGGGLKTMQAASISTGILFLIVLFIMCWSLVKSLGRGHKKRLKKFKQKHPNAWVESDA